VIDDAVERLLSAHGLRRELAPKLCALIELLADDEAPTAVHDPAESVDVHLADSLAGLEVPELRAARRVADLGAGAGLPGLPLALALPGAHVLLVESQRRKCAFLERAIVALGLVNAEVVCARAEELSATDRDAVTARAVAALPVLCEYAAPLLADGGVLVAWKGAVGSDEDADGLAAATTLGLEREAVRPVEPYAGSERRTLHVFRKIAPTPAGYPRRAGMAAKRPLRAA
jgi:16S rRNA (guanine527-N7)-methyltransferase